MLARRLAGQTIEEVGRLGKRVVLTVSGGSAVVIEPRMTGLMLLSDPPDLTHLRLEWQLGGRGQYRSLWFWDRRGLGTVRLFAPGEIERDLKRSTVGPDALEMTIEAWRSCCAATSRAIKVVLLDQRLWQASAICTPARSCICLEFHRRGGPTASRRPSFLA